VYCTVARTRRRRRISSTNCAEFPWRRSRRLTSHAAVEFLLRRRILSPAFDAVNKKSAYLRAISFLHLLQRSTNFKLQLFNLQLF